MLFPYLELAASLFILFMAFETIARHSPSPAGRFFARLALITFLSAIFEYSVRIALTFDLARDIHRITGILWAFLFPTFTHFCLVFTNNKKILEDRYTKFWLYGPAVLISIFFFFTNLMITRYEIWNIGIVYQPSPWYWLYLLETFFYVAVGIFLLYRFALAAHQAVERKQAMIIATGSLIALLIGGTTDEVIPLVLGHRLIFPTAIFALTIMHAFVYFGMRRYSLFAIHPWRAADAIIEAMPDSLIVTDIEGKIILVNDEAHKYFHVSKEEILGGDIRGFFERKDLYDKLFQEVVDKGLTIERYDAKLRDPLGQELASLINAAVFHDSFGAALGIAFIIRDIRG